MMRWTSTHKIPFDFPGRRINDEKSHPIRKCSTVVNGKLWFFHRFFSNEALGYVCQFCTFDPKSLETTVFDYEIPNRITGGIESFADSDDGFLHILVRTTTTELATYKLLKFDTNIEKFVDEGEVTFNSYSLEGEIKIFGNKMYYMEWNNNVILNTIDLKTKQKIKSRAVANDRQYENLMVHNGKMYFFQCIARQRNVFLLEENGMQLLKVDRWLDPICGRYSFFNNTMVITTFQQIDYENICDKLYIDTYNFEKNEWQRKECPDFYINTPDMYVNTLIAAEQIDNKLYVIMHNHNILVDCDIRVLDIQPTLTDICLFDLIDQIANGADKESIANRIPIGLRSKLEAESKKERVESDLHQLSDDELSTELNRMMLATIGTS